MTRDQGPGSYRIGVWVAREDWPLWVLFAALLAAAVVLRPILPDQMPIHWNIKGQVDGWADRDTTAFGIPALAVLVYLVIFASPLLDPRRASYGKFLPTLRVIRWSVSLLMIALGGLMFATALGAAVPVPRVVLTLVGLLMVVLGNVLGRIRGNWFFGVRTPWSLSSDGAWRSTHRAAGPAFVIGGLLIFAGAFVGGAGSVVLLCVGVAGPAVFSAAWSYAAYRAEHRRQDNPGG